MTGPDGEYPSGPVFVYYIAQAAVPGGENAA